MATMFHSKALDMSAFNARKSAQVIAFLISKSGATSINVLKAIKLVYLGDRCSIEKFGFPILDETRVAMPRGPVNSTTYSHVNGEFDLDACGWSEFLEDRAQHQIGARRAFELDELDELSDADIECLDEVWGRFGHMNQWQLVDYTHDRSNVPEWEDPNGSSKPIPLERIMTLLSIGNADAQAALVEDHRHIDRVFSSLRS
ncbi:Panacea domain-containing protein [Rhodopseudomonas sp. RCAM05734]|uniref:Panacea domain-containing protein n=1 Tax=Rhodopseudomonas sp. RCAM05734 TaxID=3457549 RepID=UPI004043B642